MTDRDKTRVIGDDYWRAIDLIRDNFDEHFAIYERSQLEPAAYRLQTTLCREHLQAYA
jgi:hypothetical protein